MHLIVAPQLSSGWQHNYSTKTWQAGWANEQSMYSLMSMHYGYGPMGSLSHWVTPRIFRYIVSNHGASVETQDLDRKGSQGVPKYISILPQSL